MSRCEFEALGRALVRRRGVVLGAGMMDVASARLWPRVAALGLSGFAGYVRYLEQAVRGDEEIDLAWELVWNETNELLAEPGGVEELARSVIWPLVAARRYERRLRVWLPSCGRGADAYSLALVMLGVLGNEASSWSVSVVGTDVSGAAVAAAREGVFAAHEARRLSASVRSAWFTNEDGLLRARGWLRERVRFERLDARDAMAVRRLDGCDIAVLSGRLAGMDAESRAQVLERVGERLAGDGVCVVGRGEALMAARGGFDVENGTLLAVARGARALAAAA